MTREEALKKAWDLVHNKYPENNEEIQLVRYAIKTAMELEERNTPLKPEIGVTQNGRIDLVCLSCDFDVVFKENYCSHCGQRLDWN